MTRTAFLLQAVTEKIHDAIVKAASHPKLRDRLVTAGFEPAGQQGANLLASDNFDRNAAIVKAYNIKLN